MLCSGRMSSCYFVPDVRHEPGTVPPAGAEPVPETADGWEPSDPTRPDMRTEGDLPSSTGPEATRGPSHLDTEERPGGDHAKPGLIDKLRGKVDDIRGDEGPRR